MSNGLDIEDVRRAYEKVDAYHPVYGLEEHFRERQVSRDCKDRCIYLDGEFGDSTPNLRILDVGCSMGYLSLHFAERRALVTGLDHKQENVDFCKSLAKSLNLNASFKRSEFDLAFCDSVEEGQFDTVFLFSVLHHVITTHGLAAVQEMMRQLTDKCDVLYVELARKSENVPFAWKDKLPDNELDIFAGIPDLEIELLGHFPALGSITERPLYRVRKKAKKYNGILHEEIRVTRSVLSNGETNDRKYIRTDAFFTKCFIFEKKRETYFRFLAEAEAYNRLRGASPHILPLIAKEQRGRLGILTFPNAQGIWLAEALDNGQVTDIRRVALQIISVLDALSRVGLYWNDLRGHNLIFKDGDVTAIDFEVAAPVEIENTLNIFLWLLHDLQMSGDYSQRLKIFRNGSKNVTRPDITLEQWSDEIRDIAKVALSSDNIREFLAKLRAKPGRFE